MPALPTIAANAPYVWAALCDLNGLPLVSPLPVTVASSSLTNFSADAVAPAAIPENGIGLFNGATVDRWRSTGVGNANINIGIPLGAPYLFHGSNFDAQRNNLDAGAIITAVAVTTNQTTGNQFNLNGRGVKVVLNMTNAGTGSVTLHIQGFDSGGSAFYDQLVGAAVVANSVNVYTVYPGIPNSANVSASDIVPRTWRIQVIANNGNPTTYTVSAVTML
jgi:hypothetical protein